MLSRLGTGAPLSRGEVGREERRKRPGQAGTPASSWSPVRTGPCGAPNRDLLNKEQLAVLLVSIHHCRDQGARVWWEPCSPALASVLHRKAQACVSVVTLGCCAQNPESFLSSQGATPSTEHRHHCIRPSSAMGSPITVYQGLWPPPVPTPHIPLAWSGGFSPHVPCPHDCTPTYSSLRPDKRLPKHAPSVATHTQLAASKDPWCPPVPSAGLHPCPAVLSQWPWDRVKTPTWQHGASTWGSVMGLNLRCPVVFPHPLAAGYMATSPLLWGLLG